MSPYTAHGHLKKIKELEGYHNVSNCKRFQHALFMTFASFILNMILASFMVDSYIYAV